MRASYKAVLNDKPRPDGSFLLMIRITYNRKKKHYGSPYHIHISDWNPELPEAPIRKSNIIYRTINKWVDQRIIDCKLIFNELERTKKPISAEIIRECLKNVLSPIEPEKEPEIKEVTFFGFADAHVLKLKQGVQDETVANSTYKNIKSAVNYVRRFANGRDFPFSELTPEFAQDFKDWLLVQKQDRRPDSPIKYNTAYSIIKKLTKLIGDVVDKQHNAFLALPLKGPDKVFKERLSDSEIEKLQALELPFDNVRFHAQQIFLMDYYCSGSRIGDMIMIKWSNIEWMEGLPARLHFRTIKSGYTKSKSVKLKTDAIRILMHYWGRGKQSNEFVFPYLDNDTDYSHRSVRDHGIANATTLINKYLKTVAGLAGIRKPVSTHIARHTFARKALSKTSNVKIIMNALGHSKMSTTQMYVEEFNQVEQDDLLDDVFD